MLEFKTSSDGVWKTYPADRDVQVKIRPITKSAIRKLSKKATITKSAREGGKMVQQETIDNVILDELLVDHMVEDWEGIVEDGNKKQVTTENKIAVMDRYLQLSQWVNDTAFLLGELADGVKSEKKTA
jgi:hypothetical protein